MRYATLLLTSALLLVATNSYATDWISAASYYSHDPVTGEQLSQYSPIGPFYAPQRSDYSQSGYRHIRSSIRTPGGGSDNLHIVQEWGRTVRPYGEWQFPHRPYSTPYQNWGVPFGGLEGRRPYYGRRPFYPPHPTPYEHGDLPAGPGVGPGVGPGHDHDRAPHYGRPGYGPGYGPAIFGDPGIDRRAG